MNFLGVHDIVAVMKTEVAIMPRKKYTAEFKAKTVLSILQGDKEFNVICSENGLNPNMCPYAVSAPCWG